MGGIRCLGQSPKKKRFFDIFPYAGGEVDGGDDKDHDLSVHLSLHPNLNIIPGHPNLPGDPGTTESDNQQKSLMVSP